MKIKATPTTGKELIPGDLFSTMGPEYWKNIDSFISIGERVYIRTNTPSSSADDANELIYKIEIKK
jgi:hypothetical protein